MVAGQAVDDGRPGSRNDEWLRFRAFWHGGFVGLVILTSGLAWTISGMDTAPRVEVLGMMAVLVGWYALIGARAVRREPGWFGRAYVAVAAPVTVALFAVTPVGALLLIVLYPHVWLMLKPRWAVVVTCAVVASVGVVVLSHNRLDGSAVTMALLLSVASLVIALVLGLWIARIIRQSRQRAELVAQLAAARAELAAVSREAGALAERERLAREIHDTLAQGFTSVLLLLHAAKRVLVSEPDAASRYLDRARDTAAENLAEARALVTALTPPNLVGTSLPEALRRLVERLRVDAGPHAELTVVGAPRGLPAEHEVALLRMTQESLTNVRRHAGATSVEVTLTYTPARVSLRVSDDGRGFDPAMAHEGFGLTGIQARAEGIGGTATIHAEPGVGAVIHIDVPAVSG